MSTLGDIMSTLGDIMMHVGDIISTLGDVQYIGGYNVYRCTHDIPQSSGDTMYTDVLMISPNVLNIP